MASTREKILVTALRRFNEEGLNAVGMREIAETLNLSPGNVTYHFPKKEDLVRALAEQLSERNDATLDILVNEGTLAELLASIEKGLDNNYEYRFLAAARTQILTEYATCSEGYAAVETRRRNQMGQALTRLRDRGELRKNLSDAELSALRDVIILLVRSVSPDRIVREFSGTRGLSSRSYVWTIAQVLSLAATEKGRSRIEDWKTPPQHRSSGSAEQGSRLARQRRQEVSDKR